MRATKLLTGRSATSSKQTALSSGKFGEKNSRRRTEGNTSRKFTSSSATSLSVTEKAWRHGTLGMFGEDGGEAVHSAMMRAAQLCQTMKTHKEGSGR
jgi:hypothetical protein